jgi:hypothetical protein
MTRAERIRNFPKTGWHNLLARHLMALTKRPAATQFIGYPTQTVLHLLFVGEWYVYWGGRSVAQNRHVVARDQRFAYDFLILGSGSQGQSYRGTGENNTDYYCFGLPIYAPANGTVVKVENDLPDTTPGEMNPKAGLGNCAILNHGRNEFSFLSHFRCGTVVVRSGDEVHCGANAGAMRKQWQLVRAASSLSFARHFHSLPGRWLARSFRRIFRPWKTGCTRGTCRTTNREESA